MNEFNCTFFICFIFYALKTPISWPPGVSALDALNDSTWQRHLAEKIVVLSLLFIKQIKIFMKSQLYTNASKSYQ